MKKYIVDFMNGAQKELDVEWTDEVRFRDDMVIVNGQVYFYNVRWLYVI